MSEYKRPEFGTGYMDRAVYDLPGIIEHAKDDLMHVDFDTLVGTGFSGAVVIPALAMAMDKPWLLIRKESDDSHHGGGKLVGNLGERWVFIDDFVSSGATLKRVYSKIADAASMNDKTSKFVGVWSYGFGQGSGSNFQVPDHFKYCWRESFSDADPLAPWEVDLLQGR